MAVHFVCCWSLLVHCFVTVLFVTILNEQYAGIVRHFAELLKTTISFVMSVCQPVRPFVYVEQLGSHWTNFHEICFFFKICLEGSSVIEIWQEYI